MISATIDWVSLTHPWDSLGLDAVSDVPLLTRAKMPESAQEGSFKRIRGMHGYRYGWQHKTGWKVMCSEPGDANGIHLIVSGSVLQRMDHDHRLDLLRDDVSVSRLDLALDLTHRDARSVDRLWRAYKSGKVATRAQKYRRLESTGITFELGRRSSERFLRIYDKMAQANMSFPWTRIELELKAKQAQQARLDLLRDGIAIIPRKIADFADFPFKWWRDLVKKAPKVGTPQTEKLRNTRKWMQEAVAPSLARLESEQPGFLQEFVNQVSELLTSPKYAV